MRTLLAIGAAVVASVLLLEVLVRMSGIAAHLFTEPAFEASADGTYWRYRDGFEGTLLGPTHARIGRMGVRLDGNERASGAPVVAVFGDSITFGQAVDSNLTFCALLEQRLRRRWPSARVLNFGVQGHSLEMQVAHLADTLRELHPDLVILAFGTDDLNPERGQNYVDRFGYLTKKAFGPPSLVADYVRAGLRRSHVALAIKNAYLTRKAGKMPAPPGDGDRGDLASKVRVFRTTLRRFDA